MLIARLASRSSASPARSTGLAIASSYALRRTMASDTGTTASIIAIDSSTNEPLTNASTSSSISSQWSSSSPKGKPFETRIFYSSDSITAAIGLGKKAPKTEEERSERSRKVAATGALALKDKGAKVVKVDPVYNAHAAAEGAVLATFNWVRCAAFTHSVGGILTPSYALNDDYSLSRPRRILSKRRPLLPSNPYLPPKTLPRALPNEPTTKTNSSLSTSPPVSSSVKLRTSPGN